MISLLRFAQQCVIRHPGWSKRTGAGFTFVANTYHSTGALTMSQNINVDKEELRKRLTPLQFHVTQEKGTERPFSGCYNKVYEEGIYACLVCEQPLFSSDTKYDSSCGWPAFNDVLDQGKVKLTPDTSGGRIRTEVTCAQCGSHLGHVFNDGPPPTKKRFCINSASLNFIAKNLKAGNSK
ncbi:methionine-R-sulfoxide reductase B1 isoform X2 [Euwallacea similis]|uniref:methionine-R-sulfoxide reductase B1 isoform X2 n=1 Tax=Euwallacea similis TaxID=1736056 RepID=UPI00344F2E2C